MALEVDVGTFTAPTSNGATSTINLTNVGTLKALILWTSSVTANAAIDGDAVWSMGFVTNDGGTIQHVTAGYFSDDANAASACARNVQTNACLRCMSSAALAVSFSATCTTFSNTQFVITWGTAPATAIKVNYMAIGGSDLTAARAISFTTTTAVATQDVTVTAGFGQPDLVLFIPTAETVVIDRAGNATAELSVAAPGQGRSSGHYDTNAQVAMLVGSYQSAKGLHTFQNAAGPATDSEADLSSQGSWPTDGFQLSYSDQAARANLVIALALKGSFTKTIASGVAPVTTAPVTQDLEHGATPRGVLLWGTPLANAAGIVSSSAGNLGGFMVGAGDGTVQAVCGVTQNDADPTSSTGRWWTPDWAIGEYTPVAAGTNPPALQSGASHSITGTKVVLTWSDTDTVAREYSYLIIGDGAAPVTMPLSAAAGVAAASETVTAATRIALNAAPATGTGALAVATADNNLILNPGVGTSGGTLAMGVASIVPLNPAVATATPQNRVISDPLGVRTVNLAGLQVYLRLGELVGPTVLDETGGNHDGLAEGATFGLPGLVSTSRQRSITLSGASRITVPASPSINYADVLTFRCVFQRSRMGVEEVLVEKGPGALEVVIDTANRIVVRKSANPSLVIARSSTGINDFRRHMLHVTKNGTTTKIYLDGADITGVITNQTLVTTPDDLLVGA